MNAYTRCETVGVLAAAVAAGLASGSWWDVRAQPPSRRRVIRALTGDLDPATLRGPVLFHEHVSMRFPLERFLACTPA